VQESDQSRHLSNSICSTSSRQAQFRPFLPTHQGRFAFRHCAIRSGRSSKPSIISLSSGGKFRSNSCRQCTTLLSKVRSLILGVFSCGWRPTRTPRKPGRFLLSTSIADARESGLLRSMSVTSRIYWIRLAFSYPIFWKNRLVIESCLQLI
jgi:hypothetical protein